MAADGGVPEILFEDDTVIGVVKPAGLATANAPRGVDSLHAMVADRRAGGFVGVVSRLDQPVSGVVVFACTPAAAADLAAQFRHRRVAKTYLAVVEGRFPAPLGEWVEWVDALATPGDAADADRRTARFSGPAPGADDDTAPSAVREARLRARVLRRAGEVSLVELSPETGRKHQLRRQLSLRRCPIVGDRRYGARLPFGAGIALHALRLGIRHPATRKPLTLVSPPPDSWRRRFPSLEPFAVG